MQLGQKLNSNNSISMASDLFVFDSSFFTDQFSPFSDSSIDILQSFQTPTPIPLPDSYETPAYELDQIATTLLSSSAPRHQLGNLSVSQTTQLDIPSNFPNRFLDHSFLEVKTEKCQLPSFYSTHDYSYHDSDSFLPHSYGGTDNAVKMMQRSFSSNCFEGKRNFHFQQRFDSLMESPIFGLTTPQAISSPESCFSSGQMRRVFSTGDLQKTKTNQTESSFMEEANSKVGRYSAEERKERIHRYRAKRTQRNFNKTIKYECRKTLADNRPRIRGRFARNDELGETPKATTYYEDDLWNIEGVHEAEDEGIRVGRIPIFSSSYGTGHQFQYYGYA